MSNVLDQLLGKIDDPSLKGAIAREVDRLRDTKEFGLVFERHLPETAKLTNHPVRRDTTVQRRAQGDQPDGVVIDVKDGVATVAWHEGDTEEVPVDELVVVAAFGEPIYPGLRSVEQLELGGDKPFHAVINAENYHALQMLQFTHRESVDLIYIDPPYNRGDDLTYNDKRVAKDDAFRHSKWLSFMDRRLRLADRLLRNNGVLLISIGRDEIHHLTVLCDQLFPSRDVHTLTVQTSGGKSSGGMKYVHEYVVAVLPRNFTPYPTSFTGGTERSPWEGLTLSTFDQTERPNQTYPVYIDEETGAVTGVGSSLQQRLDAGDYDGKLGDFDFDFDEAPAGSVTVWPITSKGDHCIWRLSQESFEPYWENGFIKVISNRYKANPNKFSIQYLPEGVVTKYRDGQLLDEGTEEGVPTLVLTGNTTEGAAIPTMWSQTSHYTAKGTSELAELLGENRFAYPKPTSLMRDLLAAFSQGNRDAVILDFFVGSGSTVQAVMELNEEDGGSRQCIAVTNNELEADRAAALRDRGVLPGEPEWEQWGIFEYVTKPRVEALATGTRPDGSEHSDGLEENVELFELTYQHPSTVARGRAFAEVAPLLWLMAGARGPRVNEPCGGYAAPDGSTYAVLFDPTHVRDLVTALDDREEIETVFIVTDSTAVYQQAAAEMPAHVETVRLYESYLRSFEINTGDDL